MEWFLTISEKQFKEIYHGLPIIKDIDLFRSRPTNIEEYKAGDAEALAALVEKYRRPLFAYLINMTSANSDADELFQETWFRVIKKIDSYKQQNFYGWITRIAHNLTIDKIRKRKPEFSLDAEIGDGETTTLSMISSSLVTRVPVFREKVERT